MQSYIFLNSSVGDVCDRHQWWIKGAKRSGSNKENFEAVAKKATMLQQEELAKPKPKQKEINNLIPLKKA